MYWETGKEEKDKAVGACSRENAGVKGTNWIGRRTGLCSGELVLNSKAGSGSARVDAQLVVDRGQM